MLEYTTTTELELADSPASAYDVLSDIESDLRGLTVTLSAIAQQPSIIEPEQIETLGDMVFLMCRAVCAVKEHLGSAPADGDISISALAAEIENDGRAA